MRLWSIHPQYLDRHGLIALWREGLLAQKILNGEENSYSHHPQLERFRQFEDPLKAIGSYLSYIAVEGARRGYKLSHEKIMYPNFAENVIAVNDGQLTFEMKHLQNKLKLRDKPKLRENKGQPELRSHPMFDITNGGREFWEKSRTIH